MFVVFQVAEREIDSTDDGIGFKGSGVERIRPIAFIDSPSSGVILKRLTSERMILLTELTHFNAQGRAKMVDVSDKKDSVRTARATTSVLLNKAIYQQIKEGTNKKGDVFAVAQVAGIMAAKNTAQIIPMCHPLALSGVDIEFQWNVDEDANHFEVLLTAEVKTKGPTGVEMEALTAASAAALTIYDMCKAAGKEMVIGPTMLLQKTGGKSGDYARS